MRSESDHNKAVLLLRARSFFGANVVNLPAIYFTKNHLHSNQLIVFSDINLRSFYAQVPWVSEQYETQHFLSIWKKIPKGTTLLYSMRPSMDSAPLFKWANHIPTVIGLSLRSSLLNKLFDLHLPCPTTQYRALAHLAPLLAYSNAPLSATYYLRESMLNLVDYVQAERSICLMPGAGGGEQKKWGIKNFFGLAQAIQFIYPSMQFHFILGHNESEEKTFLSQQQHSGLNFTIQENLSLSSLTTLIENSLLTVANDCGPSHISQCLVKPFIGLYKEPNPEWFHAHPQSVSICPQDNVIQSISMTEVLENSLHLLNQQKIALY